MRKEILLVASSLLVAMNVHAASNRPSGYKTICKTGKACAVSSPTKVAFGASGKFVFKVVDGAFSCDTATFGSDPNPKKKKKECSAPKDGSGVSGNSSSSTSSSSSSSTSSSSSSSSASSSSSGGGSGLGADCNALKGYSVITVGKGGQYSKLQKAVNSVPKKNSKLTIIKIAPGTYREKVVIDRPNIMLCGEKGKAESTKLTYNDNNKKVGSTKGTYTVYINADDVSVENVTIENTFGKGQQAVALTAAGDRLQFRNTRFLGYQDTLYVYDGLQYYKNCYIEGRTDYIFGRGTGVFHHSVIHHIDKGGAITAPKTLKSNKFGLVFIDSKVTAKPGVGDAILGRNWGADGSTVFIRTELGSHIKKDAWTKMGDNSLSTARFYEYKSFGPGANPSARSSRQLTDREARDFTVKNIFGGWTPSFSL